MRIAGKRVAEKEVEEREGKKREEEQAVETGGFVRALAVERCGNVQLGGVEERFEGRCCGKGQVRIARVVDVDVVLTSRVAGQRRLLPVQRSRQVIGLARKTQLAAACGKGC